MLSKQHILEAMNEVSNLTTKHLIEQMGFRSKVSFLIQIKRNFKPNEILLLNYNVLNSLMNGSFKQSSFVLMGKIYKVLKDFIGTDEFTNLLTDQIINQDDDNSLMGLVE